MRFIAGLPADADYGPRHPRVLGEHLIYHGHRYMGRAFHWSDGLGWTHSIQAYGTAAFASPDLAEADFWSTKERLPQHVHAGMGQLHYLDEGR